MPYSFTNDLRPTTYERPTKKKTKKKRFKKKAKIGKTWSGLPNILSHDIIKLTNQVKKNL